MRETVDYVLPCGTSIQIDSELKSKAPEILFQPGLVGFEYPGIHEMVNTCIQSCDIDLRRQLSGAIVVAGSTTMMDGFCQRLHKQI